MNWRKLVFITIVALYSFGFSNVFGYTPLTTNQLKEIRTTLEVQLNDKKITRAELNTLYQELIKIKNEVIAYQKKPNPTFWDKTELYTYVVGIGFAHMGILIKFHLPDYVKKWPDDPSDPRIVEDISKIEDEVKIILNETPASTSGLCVMPIN